MQNQSTLRTPPTCNKKNEEEKHNSEDLFCLVVARWANCFLTRVKGEQNQINRVITGRWKIFTTTGDTFVETYPKRCK